MVKKKFAIKKTSIIRKYDPLMEIESKRDDTGTTVK